MVKEMGASFGYVHDPLNKAALVQSGHRHVAVGPKVLLEFGSPFNFLCITISITLA